MSATSNPAESEFSKGSLPVKKPLVEKLTIDPANLKNDRPQSERPRLGKRILLAVALITFCVGAATALAWQAYGDAARKTFTSSFPQLAWLAPPSAPVEENTSSIPAPTAAAAPFPDQQQLNAMALDLDAVRQSVEQIATSQEQMARTVEQLSAGQEQVTREINKLQATEQYILYKNSEPSAPKPVARPSQGRTAR
jgi:hypothetical protein